MTIKYEYKSTCCGHEYVEQRAAEEPMFFPNCNACQEGVYQLVKETVLSEDVERSPGATPVESTLTEVTDSAPEPPIS